MSRLGAAAKEQIHGAGLTLAAWSRAHFTDGRWHGDVCGCPDDRCVGNHHGADDRCHCLDALIAEGVNQKGSATTKYVNVLVNSGDLR